MKKPTSQFMSMCWTWFGSPMLFGLSGAKLDFFKMSGDAVWQAFVVILVAMAARFVVTASALPVVERRWSVKDSIFVAFVWLGKAAVQATLAPVALELATTRCKTHNITGTEHCEETEKWVGFK